MRESLKEVVRRLGFWISYPPSGQVTGVDFVGDLRRIIKNPQTLLDVGANRGQSVQQYSTVWPAIQVSCVEPDHDSFGELIKLNHPSMVAYCNVAFGLAEGTETLLKYDTHTLNSMLEFCGDGETRLGSQKIIGKQQIRVVRPTQANLFNLLNQSKFDVLKSDTQGFDLNVLRGFDKEFFDSCQVIIVELNFDSVYNGQASATEVIEFCHSLSYRMVGIYEIHRRSDNGIGWGTGVFVKGAPVLA